MARSITAAALLWFRTGNNELKKATLHGMLDQLGLTLGELLKGKE